MSGSVKGRLLPKKGKVLHRAHAHCGETYPEAISAVLKFELQQGASIKTIMKWTGASERTVKVWLTGASGPRGDHLMNLLAASDSILERVLALTGREPILQREHLRELQSQLTDLSVRIGRILKGYEVPA